MKGKLNFIVGLLLGVFLVAGTGAAAAVVETVTATLNQAPIYVDDTRVELTAYNIGGYNYFKLRDIAELVDFGVEWNQETAAIQIDTTMAIKMAGSPPIMIRFLAPHAMYPRRVIRSLARTGTSMRSRM